MLTIKLLMTSISIHLIGLITLYSIKLQIYTLFAAI